MVKMHGIKTNKKIDIDTQEFNIVASKNMTIKTPDFLIDAAKFVQKDTSYTLTTSSYSMKSAAGTMSASTGIGFVYDNKLHATDLKTDSVPSQNGHKHPGDSGGTTGLPF